ncbi:hypothetical protein PHYPSEUDO_009869 [Phytophthora pseudosyringae]|uniref:Secreted protein n=1 Tax=Phytophthora pseudosyringae TaxID=221518 RepID=A0A8T1W8R1_9STRA|nr:hypothetical protein PHYPSEUDO_009869 [Phytophthora pseudosyringae]
MIPNVKLPAALQFVFVLVAVAASSGPARAVTDPAELIPVVPFASIDGSSTLDPANWSPNTPQPSVVADLNKTRATPTDGVDCLECNGTRVLVHGIGKSFCVHGWPICSTDDQQGLCPPAQQELPNGAYCSPLPSNTSMYGCLEKTGPIACHFRLSTT